MFWRKSDFYDVASMSTIPLSKTLQARCFRIHNSLDFEQVIWGICWLLQNMSTESGSIPTIKPIGNASSNIFEQLSSQIKTILISCRYKSGFAIKWIMAPNLERKNKQKNDTFAFKAFWIRDCRPLTSLTSLLTLWFPQTALTPGLWLGWGDCLPPQTLKCV